MDVTGLWKYSEDFGFGNSKGTAELVQTSEKVIGIFRFIEFVEGSYQIEVIEETSGHISQGMLFLNSTKVTAKSNGELTDYLPNNYEIHLVSNEKLVGSTYDQDNVCGVFTLERM